jgi:sRNA-binding carbon storage regulator CsrA
MLVLTRNTDGNTDKSKVTITAPNGDVIEISLFDGRGNSQIKIGLDAPQSYKMVRNELLNDRGAKKPLD